MTPVHQLYEFLPHRDEMVWIDFVIAADAEAGSCLVVVDAKKHYAATDGVRPSAFVEWMAQSFGYASAHYARSSGSSSKVEKAFLVGLERVTFSPSVPQAGDEVVVEIKLVRKIGPVSYVEGKVSDRKSKSVYSEAMLKLFSVESPGVSSF